MNSGETWGCSINCHLVCPWNPGQAIAKWARGTGCSLGVFVGYWPWHPGQLVLNKPGIEKHPEPSETHLSTHPTDTLLQAPAQVASLPQAVTAPRVLPPSPFRHSGSVPCHPDPESMPYLSTGLRPLGPPRPIIPSSTSALMSRKCTQVLLSGCTLPAVPSVNTAPPRVQPTCPAL